ncbi:MAG: 1-deoxy-D-xylulose-5-phosphate reductoisomerase [Lachnospiraceae bacterium]|nr:1-deoxy-D-xylulose-5-phosphate reductoisomerase [Lachnospiraceae bacterium]
MKRISILGSTGSIGTQTLDVVRKYPDRFRVTALSCAGNIGLLEQQIREFRPPIAAVYDEKAANDLRVRTKDLDVRICSGMEGLIEITSQTEADIVVTAIVGMIGIVPTWEAIMAGRDIALANKETLVTAGHLIMDAAREKGVRILPVDSEHSAIFQALQGRADSKIRNLWITASGGPFRNMSAEELEKVTVKEALAHPTWQMGPKITIDSATMVNKGLEVMEARWLFDVTPDQIKVVIQPQSVIHSMVEYEDGSVIAQMGVSDMRIPIQYALTYPTHLPSPAKPLDFTALQKLDFATPRNEIFKGLPLAIEALKKGGSMPAVFNAANEWANARFREGLLRFPEIYDVISFSMSRHQILAHPSLQDILALQGEVERDCEHYGR